MAETSSYVMGHTDEERRRLIQQSAHLAPLTEVMLQRCGLAPGMRVLDVGCGTGGVSHQAARVVGPTGRVTGLDRDLSTLAIARELAEFAQLPQIEFVNGTPDSVSFPEPFDAVIGRFVLIHQKDPLALVRQTLPLLRDGGIVAFLEPDFSPRPVSWPHTPLFERLSAYISDLFVRIGLPYDMGLRLRKTFHDAGLTSIGLKVDAPADGGPGSPLYAWLANTMVSLAPAMEKVGIVTVAELDLPTLTARLESEAVATGAHLQVFQLVAAWGRKAG